MIAPSHACALRLECCDHRLIPQPIADFRKLSLVKDEKVRSENPTFIATQEILWLRSDGNNVLIQASIGIPYRTSDYWACPVALIEVDGRYPDRVGVSSFQSLTLAMRLIRQRLGHLLDAGEVLVFPNSEEDRWDQKVLDALFGNAD